MHYNQLVEEIIDIEKNKLLVLQSQSNMLELALKQGDKKYAQEINNSYVQLLKSINTKLKYMNDIILK